MTFLHLKKLVNYKGWLIAWPHGLSKGWNKKFVQVKVLGSSGWNFPGREPVQTSAWSFVILWDQLPMEDGIVGGWMDGYLKFTHWRELNIIFYTVCNALDNQERQVTAFALWTPVAVSEQQDKEIFFSISNLLIHVIKRRSDVARWQGAQHLHLQTCFNILSQETISTLQKSIHLALWLFCDYTANRPSFVVMVIWLGRSLGSQRYRALLP